MTKREIWEALKAIKLVLTTPSTISQSWAIDRLVTLERSLNMDIEAETEAFLRGDDIKAENAARAEVDHVRTQPLRAEPPRLVLDLPAGAEVTIRMGNDA